jgi:multiple sugar transport system permease protein
MTSASVDAPAAARPALVRRKPPAHVRRRRFLLAVANHGVLIFFAVLFLAPFVFIVLTALMTNDQALSTHLWPHPFRWSNFTDVFSKSPFWRWGVNSLIYSTLATLGLLLASIPVAYALAKLRWRGREVAFIIVMVALMLPPQVSVVPVYVMWSKLGDATGIHFIGNLSPLIIPNWFGDAFSIFLLRQFFLTIPEEYLDAARVDGCGELRILTTVVPRLAKPAIVAVGIFSVLYTFSDFFLPLLYVGDAPSNWTLSIGLSEFRSLHQVQWNLTMAATVLVMAPVIVLFFLAQRAFVEGVTLTGVKG